MVERSIDPGGGGSVRRELGELREQIRRYQLYLGASLAGLGLTTLVSVGLLAFFGVRLSSRVSESETEFRRVSEEATATMESMSTVLAQQQQELAAIRRAANEDLKAMRDAHQKLSAIRDPQKEIGALREANQALWTELANQRADLLKKLEERELEPSVGPESGATAARFRLGETRYVEAGASGPVKGFLEGDERIHRATSAPAPPGELVIELGPDEVALGDSYELRVRFVNEGNRPLDAAALRLDWSFGGQNTGGDVPLDVARVAPRAATLLYVVSGQWTSAHARGPASVTATLTLEDGARLENTLRW